MPELKFAGRNGDALFSLCTISVFCLSELRVWPCFHGLSYFSQEAVYTLSHYQVKLCEENSLHILSWEKKGY